MAQESLKVRLLGDATSLNASLSASQKKLQSFGKSVTKIGQEMSLKFTLPLSLAGGAAIKMASDFEETDAKFNTVFSSMREQANATAKTFKESFGLSSLAAKDLLSNTGDLLVGFGFAESEALNLSKQVNELAVDLASFTNFSGGAEGASQALTKALLGERESIKSLGIAITEADLKEFAADQGLVFKELDRVAKATLTYQLAAKQSSKAIGDFSRTQDSFANQMRQLKGDVSDVAVEFGKILLPIAKDLVKVFRGFAKRLEEMSPAMKKVTLVVAGLLAGIGPLLIVVGKLSLGISAIGGALPIATKAMKALNLTMRANPILAVASALVAIGTALYGIAKAKKAAKLEEFQKGLEGLNREETTASLKKLNDEVAKNNEIIHGSSKIYEKSNAKKRNKELAIQIKLHQDRLLELRKENDAQRQLNQSIETNTKVTETNNRGKVSALDLESITAPKKGITPLKGVATLGDPASALADSVGNGNILLEKKLVETKEMMTAKQMEFAMNAAEFNSHINGIMESGIQSMAMGIGGAIGDAMSGAGDLVGGLSKVLLGGIGTMAMQLGQLAISIGITMEGIKKAFESLNPVVAIAAGVALIALGKFFKNKSAQIGKAKGKGPVAFAKGGIVSSPTLGLVGEYSGARSNPEVIAPLDKLKNMIGDRGQSVNVSGEFSLKGQDLVVALQRANRNRDRII